MQNLNLLEIRPTVAIDYTLITNLMHWCS